MFLSRSSPAVATHYAAGHIDLPVVALAVERTAGRLDKASSYEGTRLAVAVAGLVDDAK